MMHAYGSSQPAMPAPTGSEERLCALYSRARLRALLVEMALVVLFLVGSSVTGEAHQLDEALGRYLPAGFGHVALDLFLTLLAIRLALLPLHWIAGYRLERRFKLLHQSPSSWLWDWALVS